MNKKKMGLLALAVLAAAAIWVLMNYHVVGFRLYPKDAQALDLRGQEISLKHYEALQEKLPGIPIRWDVPFQGNRVSDDAEEITVTTLSQEDVAVLAHLKNLKTVHGESCQDYAQLAALQQQRPEVQVNYLVNIGSRTFGESARQLTISTISQEELERIQYLPDLREVIVSGSPDMGAVEELVRWCQEQEIPFFVSLGGQEYDWEITAVELSDAADEDLAVLAVLPELETVVLHNPKASPEALFALDEACPQADICWDVEICGLTFDQDTLDVDLSQVVVTDLEQIEAQMAYLPQAQKLIFGLCGIDKASWGDSRAEGIAASRIPNEDLAALRDRVREQYKVVWTVRLGPDIALRTDKDNFMPGHFGMGRLFTDHAYNLRYCEDMVCLDLGHMTLTDVSFLEFMPKLKYLILAHTEVQDISPIRHCKELIFLELDWSCVKDYSPLVECTALEDLNIGNTFCDITPILEMTWLKNLWMIKGNKYDANEAMEALPDTLVQPYGTYTVGNGWRRLKNYYDMRDALGMYYMD